MSLLGAGWQVVTVACVGGRRAFVDVFVGDAVRRVSLWSEFLISYCAVGVFSGIDRRWVRYQIDARTTVFPVAVRF